MSTEIEAIDERTAMVQSWDLNKLVFTKQCVADQITDTKQLLEIINAEIVRRSAEKKAPILFTDDFEIKVEYKEEIQHRISELRKLEGKVPDEVLNKALYLEVPEPIWKANTVKLKSIANKYGEEVAAIVEAGMPRVRVGNPKITVFSRNKPQNVTQSAVTA